MDRHQFLAHFASTAQALDEWQDSWGAYSQAEAGDVPPERVRDVLGQLGQRLQNNYPYFHPRYAGQMLKPPHPVAVLAYAIAMQINPNNHALDASPATSRMEREVISDLARMFDYPETHLGHLTGGGTIANLEALWIAREIHPGKAIAVSDQAHYTHQRAAEILQAPLVTIPAHSDGKMDMAALREALEQENIGTIVATTGTTGLGAVDPVHEIIPMARAASARVHVDAAYGGFFTLLAQRSQPLVDPEPFLAIADADSVVVDPHKHALQPYGCGSVLFRDPSVGHFYVHDSPYTYFTSDELHLGEISLECSRAGAAAAALWATLECLPLAPDRGLGEMLAQARLAALRFADLVRENRRLRLVVEPELDIVTFYVIPVDTERPTASAISALTERLFDDLMHNDDPYFLAKMTIKRELLAGRDRSIVWDEPTVRALRSVLMKPEHLRIVPELHAAIVRRLENGD